jgi:predicted PhzF superfamily epimerase YddE/YHI9
LLCGYGAQYAVLLDEAARFAINNDGIIEDVATGSAAGVIGAYRLKHGLARAGEIFTTLSQGRYTGRPSQLHVQTEGGREAPQSVVGGDVALSSERNALEELP